MDAVDFLKTYRRLCSSFSSGRVDDCRGCPLQSTVQCGSMKLCDPSKVVMVVEQWAKDHPPKTRLSEFLKIFPNALLEDGVITIPPCKIDDNVHCKGTPINCCECIRDYWLKEIGDD